VVLTRAGQFSAQLSRVDLGRIWMQRGRASLPLVEHAALMRFRNPIFFLADGDRKPMHHSGIELLPGEIMFSSSGAQHYHRAPADCCWGAISLTPEALATAGRALADCDLAAPAVTRKIRPPPKLMNRLLLLHGRANDLATTAPDKLAHPEVARAIEQELVRLMVRCLSEGIDVGAHLRHQRIPVMQRLERILQENCDRPLYVAEICSAIGVADRTLRLHCLEHLGMSPHRYLWLRRMHLARRALASADPVKTTVTTIANDCGFAELGRFAVAYRRLFGESPSRTLRGAPDRREGQLPILP
jgi:AraC-like DNA-binding protein